MLDCKFKVILKYLLSLVLKKSKTKKKKLKMRQYIIKVDKAMHIKVDKAMLIKCKGGLTYDCSETDHWG